MSCHETMRCKPNGEKTLPMSDHETITCKTNGERSRPMSDHGTIMYIKQCGENPARVWSWYHNTYKTVLREACPSLIMQPKCVNQMEWEKPAHVWSWKHVNRKSSLPMSNHDDQSLPLCTHWAACHDLSPDPARNVHYSVNTLTASRWSVRPQICTLTSRSNKVCVCWRPSSR